MRHSAPGDGTVYYDKRTGLWRAAITIGYDGTGKQVRRTASARTRIEAAEARRALQIEAATQVRTRGGDMRLEGWARQWVDEVAAIRLRPRVAANTRSMVRRHIIPALGDYRLTEIGPDEVRELHAAMRAAGVSDRTVQIGHTTLSTMLRDAVREGRVPFNPCDRVDRPRANSRMRDALTASEASRLLSTEHRPGWAVMWATALMTGARVGELTGLEWSRIDLDAGVIDLSWQLQVLPWRHGDGCACKKGARAGKCPRRKLATPPGYRWRPCDGARVWVETKTRASARVVPMPPPLVPVLGWWREHSPENRWGLVWVTPARRTPMDGRRVRAAWHEALDAAGCRQVDFHAARHTAASLLLDAGVSPEVIAQVLGHSSVVSSRTYMHVDRRMAADAMRALGVALGPSVRLDTGAVGAAARGLAPR